MIEITNQDAQKIFDIATPWSPDKVKFDDFNYFDNSHLLHSKPFLTEINDDGVMIKHIMYFRIYFKSYSEIIGLSLYSMCIPVTETFAGYIHGKGAQTDERTILNLPEVLSILLKSGYKIDLRYEI